MTSQYAPTRRWGITVSTASVAGPFRVALALLLRTTGLAELSGLARLALPSKKHLHLCLRPLLSWLTLLLP